MPELPEVETARRGIDQALRGKAIKSVRIIRHDLRIPIPQNTAALLTAKTCLELKRRGKYIILLFTDNIAAVLHLGMSGRIRIYDSQQDFKQQKHDHIILTINDGTSIIFHDPRRFGMFYTTTTDNWAQEKPFCDMGPEPLEDWQAADLLLALQKRKSPIKTALLDQNVVSGLGNIYVCEALFCAGISPLRISSDINESECAKLISCCRKILENAIAAGGSTLRDHKKTDGSLGYFQYQFSAYDREDKTCPSSNCKGTIKRIVQAGRSTFYCPTCQK